MKSIHTTLTGMQTFLQAIQAQLKKSSINLDIEEVEHATYHAQIRKDLSPLVIIRRRAFRSPMSI